MLDKLYDNGRMLKYLGKYLNNHPDIEPPQYFEIFPHFFMEDIKCEFIGWQPNIKDGNQPSYLLK